MKRVLLGRYEVQRVLGRGGMGEVLLAQDQRLRREVAIKTLLHGANARLRGRFLEEAQVTGQLAHPNIVSVHELTEEGGQLYLVMTLVSGKDLSQVVGELREGDPVACHEYRLPRLLRAFLKTCEAVGYAHSRRVIHRDLKPANVMVGRDDQVLVMDWGLARPLEADGRTRPEGAVRSRVREELEEQEGGLTSVGSVVGTPAYMPPEQTDPEAALDPRADVYSLGAILYELLTLRSPYPGSNVKALRALTEGPPPPPRRVAPEREIPPPLEAVVERAMERDPQRRYANAGDLAEEVRRFLDGRPVEAYDETPWEALRRTLQRNRRPLGVLGAALGVALVGVVVGGVTLAVQARGLRAGAERARASAAAAAAAEDEARRAAARGALAAEASGWVAEALGWVDRAREYARTAPPLMEERGGRAALSAWFGRARQELEGALRALERAGREDPAGVEAFVAEVEEARRALGRVEGEAYLAREPSRLLRVVGEWGLGPEEALLRARAQLRLGDRAAARAALGAAAPAALGEATRKEWLALEAVLEDARLEEQELALSVALEARPSQHWLALRRAEVRARRGNFAGAEEDLDRANQLQPLDAWVHSARARVTYPVYSDIGLLTEVRELVGWLSPENRELFTIRERNRLFVFGAWEAFEGRVAELAATEPLAAARAGAEGAQILSRWDDAERYARQVLALEVEDRVGLAVLADAQRARGQLAEAERTAAQGLARHPLDGPLNLVLGKVAMERGAFGRAVGYLEHAARPSQTSEPWRLLAECLVESADPGAWQRGVEAGYRALEVDPIVFKHHPQATPLPGDPRIHRVLGHLRRKQGRLAQAAVQYARALVLSGFGKPVEALGVDLQDAMHLGAVHEGLGLLNEALGWYRYAEQDPNQVEAAQAEQQRLLGGRSGG